MSHNYIASDTERVCLYIRVRQWKVEIAKLDGRMNLKRFRYSILLLNIVFMSLILVCSCGGFIAVLLLLQHENLIVLLRFLQCVSEVVIAFIWKIFCIRFN